MRSVNHALLSKDRPAKPACRHRSKTAATLRPMRDTASACRLVPVLARIFFRWERVVRSEEHTSELQSLMRISYAVFCLKKKNTKAAHTEYTDTTQQLSNRKS